MVINYHIFLYLCKFNSAILWVLTKTELLYMVFVVYLMEVPLLINKTRIGHIICLRYKIDKKSSYAQAISIQYNNQNICKSF